MRLNVNFVAGFGAVLVVAAIVVLAVIAVNPQPKHKQLVFDKNAMLGFLWRRYKDHKLEPGTYRTLDKSRHNITTSEGESYTMLRAVWQDDHKTFIRSWHWTKNNLQRKDHLFSWKFGKKQDGSYGVLTKEGGNNTAADGDEDIALALLMAYERWNQTKFVYQAKPIIQSIWEKEVVQVNGQPLLVADNLERKNGFSVLVNPSYFAPYEYKIFSEIDAKHNWMGLRDNSYKFLNKVMAADLNKSSSANIPPDWVRVRRFNGAARAANSSDLTTNLSYDAMRVPFRLALGYQWFHDQRAKVTLSKMGFLAGEWQQNHKLVDTYSHDGRALTSNQAPAIYGGEIGYFKVIKPKLAKQIYEQKLKSLYSADKQAFKHRLSYYDANWAWFGMALYLNKLPNLTAPANYGGE